MLSLREESRCVESGIESVIREDAPRLYYQELWNTALL